MIIEAACYIIENGLPSKQAQLVDYVSTWLGDESPSDTQIKEHVGPLYRKAKQRLEP